MLLWLTIESITIHRCYLLIVGKTGNSGIQEWRGDYNTWIDGSKNIFFIAIVVSLSQMMEKSLRNRFTTDQSAITSLSNPHLIILGQCQCETFPVTVINAEPLAGCEEIKTKRAPGFENLSWIKMINLAKELREK